jgi:hypothetical protein
MGGRKAPVLERPLLKLDEAAAYVGVSPRQLRRWHEGGTLPIPIVKISGRNYFHPDDLDRLAAGFERVMPNAPDRPDVPRDEDGRFKERTR